MDEDPQPHPPRPWSAVPLVSGAESMRLSHDFSTINSYYSVRNCILELLRIVPLVRAAVRAGTAGGGWAMEAAMTGVGRPWVVAAEPEPEPEPEQFEVRMG